MPPQLSVVFMIDSQRRRAAWALQPLLAQEVDAPFEVLLFDFAYGTAPALAPPPARADLPRLDTSPPPRSDAVVPPQLSVVFMIDSQRRRAAWALQPLLAQGSTRPSRCCSSTSPTAPRRRWLHPPARRPSATSSSSSSTAARPRRPHAGVVRRRAHPARPRVRGDGALRRAARRTLGARGADTIAAVPLRVGSALARIARAARAAGATAELAACAPLVILGVAAWYGGMTRTYLASIAQSQ